MPFEQTNHLSRSGSEYPARVLLVDDRPDSLMAMQAVLSGRDLTLFTADNGLDAIAHVANDEFAVILLDVQMPGIDGFETARLIRETERGRDVPIVFVTAINKDDRYVHRGYETGAIDYVFKPVDPQVLVAKVNVLVDLYRKNRKIIEQALIIRDSERRDRERLLAQLELENLRRYKNLADAVPHIIVKTSPNGTPLQFNRLWHDYTGASQEDGAGRWPHAFEDSDRERFLALWRSAMRTGSSYELEARLARSDGEKRWHLVRAVAEKGSIGETAGWIVTCTDIHDRRLAEESNRRLVAQMQRTLTSLEDKTRALEASNRDLEQFAYVASHDLQEPLRKVMSYTDLLQPRMKDVDGETGRYFSYVVDGVGRMKALIEGLLAYSRVQHQAKPHDTIDVDEIVRQSVESLNASISESGAGVRFSELPRIKGEETQIGQLFQNLISNAIKFRGEAPPEIFIEAEPRGDEWLFRVRDNGIGLDPQYADRIFLIFQRLHARAQYPGSGIGLSICKKIVERHGGRIWVESIPGQGATFLFTLPGDRTPLPVLADSRQS